MDLRSYTPREYSTDPEHSDTQDSIAWAEGWVGSSYSLPTEEEWKEIPPSIAASKRNADKLSSNYEIDEEVESTNDSTDLAEKMYGFGKYYGRNWGAGYDSTESGASRFLDGYDDKDAHAANGGKPRGKDWFWDLGNSNYDADDKHKDAMNWKRDSMTDEDKEAASAIKDIVGHSTYESEKDYDALAGEMTEESKKDDKEKGPPAKEGEAPEKPAEGEEAAEAEDEDEAPESED
jgi:hypothetical protein